MVLINVKYKKKLSAMGLESCLAQFKRIQSIKIKKDKQIIELMNK